MAGGKFTMPFVNLFYVDDVRRVPDPKRDVPNTVGQVP